MGRLAIVWRAMPWSSTREPRRVATLLGVFRWMQSRSSVMPFRSLRMRMPVCRASSSSIMLRKFGERC